MTKEFVVAKFSYAGGRKTNEDYCDFAFFENDFGVFAVADGMSGYGQSDIVAKLAVEKIIDEFRLKKSLDKDVIQEILFNTNKHILEYGENEDSENSKTTLAAVFTDLDTVVLAHVGNTRIYIFRNNKIIYQTKDHSLAQQAVDDSEISHKELREHEDKNKLYRILGLEKDFEAEVSEEPFILKSDDVILICTDGFWTYISEKEMEVDLLKADSPDKWLQIMLERALERVEKGHDNLTCMAIFVR